MQILLYTVYTGIYSDNTLPKAWLGLGTKYTQLGFGKDHVLP